MMEQNGEDGWENPNIGICEEAFTKMMEIMKKNRKENKNETK
jgi:hypothetical protein